MESILGAAFKDFVLVAADNSAKRSIIIVKNNVRKMYHLNEKLTLAICGEPGDSVQFAEFIEKNVQLFKIRNGFDLSTEAAANFIQNNMANYLRSRTPYQCNMLLAGWDDEKGAEFYYIDYLGSMLKVPFSSFGYGGYFTLSMFDKYYRYDMNEKEAYDLIKKCIHQIQRRMTISMPSFKIKIIKKDGITDLEDIKISVDAIGL